MTPFETILKLKAEVAGLTAENITLKQRLFTEIELRLAGGKAKTTIGVLPGWLLTAPLQELAAAIEPVMPELPLAVVAHIRAILTQYGVTTTKG